MEPLTEFGTLGLFASAFLAATILPLSSEVVLSALLLNGGSAPLLVAVATAGNVLGSCTNYAIGFWGGEVIVRKVLRLSETQLATARRRYNRYGVLSLLLAWVPVIGDPLTIAAGIARTRMAVFLVLVTAGKLARYVVLAWAVLSGESMVA